jgi:hypothetical protein
MLLQFKRETRTVMQCHAYQGDILLDADLPDAIRINRVKALLISDLCEGFCLAYFCIDYIFRRNNRVTNCFCVICHYFLSKVQSVITKRNSFFCKTGAFSIHIKKRAFCNYICDCLIIHKLCISVWNSLRNQKLIFTS